MGKIAVDSATAGQHISNITASHAEIPGAAARTQVSGNTTGGPSSEFFNKLKSAIEDLSGEVSQLQDSVSQTVDAYRSAVKSQLEHDQSVKSTITQIAASLDAGAKAEGSHS